MSPLETTGRGRKAWGRMAMVAPTLLSLRGDAGVNEPVFASREGGGHPHGTYLAHTPGVMAAELADREKRGPGSVYLLGSGGRSAWRRRPCSF